VAGVIALPLAPVVAGLGVAYRRWLGGVTGDTLGAAIELTETLALVVAAAIA
jgi:cobalamin synthase